MITPIHDFLFDYSKNGSVRCHMPGHKGRINTFDITEIEGADSLFECAGIIRESERNAAGLFGAYDTVYSCQGSTLAIQTMLAAVKLTSGKNRIAAARYSHKSLITSAVLLGFDIDWIYPDEYLSCVISPFALEKAIGNDTAAVFFASTDYYGGRCDTAALAEITRCHDLPLLCDNAHGAYLVFADEHPIQNGAAMSADSAHKTLPVLTGAAYLHTDKNYSRSLLKSAMSLFGSASPSYLMLDSLDICNKFIYENKSKAEEAFCAVQMLKERLADIGYTLRPSDYVRVTVRTDNGFKLASALRTNGVECEYCDNKNVVLLFSVITEKSECVKVFEAFDRVKSEFSGYESKKETALNLPKPKKALSPREAYFSRSEEIDVKDAAGKICAEIIAPCPPGVPVVMPGEIYSAESIEFLSSLGVKKTRVVYIK